MGWQGLALMPRVAPVRLDVVARQRWSQYLAIQAGAISL